MPSYLTSVVLEFSEDPISDTTPTWQDVTSYMKTIQWQVGIDREGNEPEAGSMTVTMKGTNRDWEPDYTASRFYPNVTTQRRFRLTLNGTQQGVWYIQSFDIGYPLGTAYSEVTITCGDGTEILALDNLLTLDPESANSYEEVVGFDEPWGYWRMGETQGTQARANIVRPAIRTPMSSIVGSRRRQGTRWLPTEAGAVAGPAGTYRNKPALEQSGLVVGDRDTCADFQSSAWVQINFDDGDLNSDAISLEAIVRPSVNPISAVQYFIAGPITGGAPAFALQKKDSDEFQFAIKDTLGTTYTVTSTTVATADVTNHVCGTYDGVTLRIYVDGVEEGTPVTTAGRPLGTWATNTIGISALPTAASFWNGKIDEAAIYEKGLSADRVAAHATAAFDRGYPQQTAGVRIAAIADSPLWSEAGIQTSGRDVVPMMQSGQAKMDVISELGHAEGPRTQFYFNGSGDPIYLGHEFQETSSDYNTVQWTFGNGAGEVSYQDIQLIYDNETFNDVTASSDSGETVNALDQTAIDDKGRRSNSDWTETLLASQADVNHLAGDILAFYKDATLRPVSITVNGSKALAQFQDLQLGHMIRVKQRGAGGTAIDRVVSILGKDVSVDENKQLLCTYRLSRGFNASLSQWHLGISGFSELGSTTVLA